MIGFVMYWLEVKLGLKFYRLPSPTKPIYATGVMYFYSASYYATF